MFGRKLRSLLDCLQPDTCRDNQTRGHDSHAKLRNFSVGDFVYAKNYVKGPRWLPGTITERLGSVMYGLLLENGQRVRKHADQLKLRMEPDNEADPDIPTDDSDQLDSGMEPDGNETDSPTEQPEQPERPNNLNHS